MKFFFPDSQDLVDPDFDFVAETHPEFRVRQRDDVYAHEIFREPPFDGLLVSKAIVDGAGIATAKYTMAQRHRLLRLGIREFLRIKQGEADALEIMGDCGAYTYRSEAVPPYSVAEVVEFYELLGFDYGISVDHVVLAFNAEWDSQLPGVGGVPDELQGRREMTLDLAADFLRLAKGSGVAFKPIGVAQGWSPFSYADSVERLQEIGYDYIALGGMVPLKTAEIVACLRAVKSVRNQKTRLHLLGVTRVSEFETFRRLGVVSFDSTSPFLQAFKDAHNNYHTRTRNYMAVRVPQVEGNPKLGRLIRSGQVDQDRARKLEQDCLELLRAYDRDEVVLDAVLGKLTEYELLHSSTDKRIAKYKEVLDARPWKHCHCDVCRRSGIEVIMFRGSERNKRRGFHNLTVFRQKVHAVANGEIPLEEAC